MRTQRTELSRSLARLLGITGHLPELETQEAILPVVNAFNLDEPPYHFKRGVFFGALQSAVAARFSALAIGCTQGTVVVVRYIVVTNPAAAASTCGLFWGIEANTTSLAAPAAAPHWDQIVGQGTNIGLDNQTPVKIGTQVAGSAANVMSNQDQLAALGSTVVYEGPFVIRAENWLIVEHLQANSPLHFRFYADVYDS